MHPHQLARVLDLVRAYGAVAQLCVLRDGQVVLDRQFGCGADALFFTYSVSKPFVALLVHLLAQRGSIRLDDPVAGYWPEYARFGLPSGLWSRRVPVCARGPRDRARAAIFNLRRTRQAVIPAAGISASARDLALFYQMLLAGGRGADLAGSRGADLAGGRGGVRVLQPSTIAEATRVSCDGEVDRILGRPVRYGHGFQLGSPGAGRAIGKLASRETFGHNGSNICNAWADPGSGLVVVYLTGRVPSRGEGARHHCEVSDGIRLACVS